MNKLYYSLLFCFIFSQSLQAQELDTTMWVTNENVYAIARDSNTIYLGGDFNYLYPNTGGGAVINLSDGKLTHPTQNPHINGNVRTSVPDGEGGWYIGGDFTLVQGIRRIGLAHILADNSLDMKWNLLIEPGTREFIGIRTMVLSNDTLYIGGRFVKVSGQARNNIAAINAKSGAVLNWSPSIEGYDQLVNAIDVLGDRVYIGGSFQKVNGQTRNFLASVDNQTGMVSEWNPQPDQTVRTILAKDTIVYVGGRFTEISGRRRDYFAAFNAKTNGITELFLNSLTPFSDEDKYMLSISSIVAYNNRLYIGGNLDLDTKKNKLLILDLGEDVFQYNRLQFKRIDGVVNQIVLNNSTLYVCGSFSKVDFAEVSRDGFYKEGLLRNGIAAINPSTGEFTEWKIDTGNSVGSASIFQDRMYLGGARVNIIRRNRLAAIDATSGKILDWNPDIITSGKINDLAVTENAVFVAGRFNTANPEDKNLIAIDKLNGQIKPWKIAADSTVNILKSTNKYIYAGGDFRKIGSHSRNKLASIHIENGQITNWNPEPNGNISALEANSNLIYVGGSFSEINGQSRKFLVAFDQVTGQLTNWHPRIDGVVQHITLLRNALYIVGYFRQVGDKPRYQFAAVSTYTGKPTDWNPGRDNSGLSSEVYSICAINNTIYVAGKNVSLTTGSIRSDVAGLDAFTGKITWKANFEFDTRKVWKATAYKGVLYVGGDFVWIGTLAFPKDGRMQAHFGVFNTSSYLSNYIKGKIFEDRNNNCQKDAGEISLLDFIVQAQPGNYFTSTDSLGNYELLIPKGKYTISQVLPKVKEFEVEQICPASDSYDIELTSTNQVITNKDFANRANIQPFLAVDISSDRRRRCFTSQTVVYYRNEGLASASNVQVKVVYPEHVIPISSSVPWKRRQGDTLFFELNTLVAQSSGSITLTDSVVCGNEAIRGLTQCTKAIITPGNQLPQDNRWDQSSLSLYATCKDNGFVRLVIKNIGKGNMADSTAYRIFLDAGLVFSANCQLNRNDSLVLEVPVNGKTIRLEADQRPYHLGESKPSITLEGCGSSANVVISKGFVDQLPQDDAAEEIAISCMPIMDSYDPNDKLASPAGTADTHFIRKEDELEYIIRFQNTGTDVAYTVVIEDDLHENLDVATLRMGASSHPNTWKISGEGKPRITWTFNNINLPDSSANEKGSHGFVSFRIRQKEDNPIGASIVNQAFITFDFNSPIATNVTYHTIGEFLPADARIAVDICNGKKPDDAIAGNNIQLSEQSTTQLHANQPNKGYGRWKLISGTATILNPEDPQTLITDLGAGKNVLEWTVYFCSQVSASQVTIERIVIPSSPIVSNPAPYCANVVIQPMKAQGENIEWFEDAALQTLLATGESYQPAISQTDTLYVTQTISGYRSLASQLIVTIQPPEKVFIANVITPNGDNKNEFFSAPELDTDSCIGQFRYVQIFNRYGKKVFESSNQNFAWNGSGISTGVYYYILSYSGFTYSGTVSVLY